MKDAFLAATGTGGTFVLTDLNPWLGLVCGVLTFVHISRALLRQHRIIKKEGNEDA